MGDWAEQARKAQVSYPKKWPTCPATLPSLSPPAPPASQGVPEISRQKRQDLGPVYRWFHTICRHHLKADSYHTKLLSGTSMKDASEETTCPATEMKAATVMSFPSLFCYFVINMCVCIITSVCVLLPLLSP